MLTPKQVTGETCERIAENYLLMQGLTLVERNVNYHKVGEIDLIMYDSIKQRLIFVEVRYRKQGDIQSASASVTIGKQRKLIKAAQLYLLKHKTLKLACRFDVVAISGALATPEIQWIPNAFYTH